MKLYHHKTDGSAEYFCSKKVKGTKNEGSFDSQFIVRIYNNNKKLPPYAELLFKKKGICPDCGFNTLGLTNKELKN